MLDDWFPEGQPVDDGMGGKVLHFLYGGSKQMGEVG